jgi:hypothetical protein
VKVLLNYYAYTSKNRRCYCDQSDFSVWHWLNECSITASWERALVINERSRRIESLLNLKDTNHNYSWIVSWCLWKVFTKLAHNSLTPDDAPFDFFNNLKNYEKLHLEYLQEKGKLEGKNKKWFAQGTHYFSFYLLDRNYKIVRSYETLASTKFLKETQILDD